MEPHVIHQREFEQIIAEHMKWKISMGRVGRQADFSNMILEDVHLVGSAQHPDERPVLSDISFRGAEMKNVSFENILGTDLDFSGAYIVDSSIRDCLFNHCPAVNMDSDNLSFRDSELYQCNLNGSSHSNLSVGGLRMDSCLLQKTQIKKCLVNSYNEISHSDFSGQRLSQLLLVNSKKDSISSTMSIKKCNFQSSSLSDCHFKGTDFLNVKWDDASINRCNFNHSKLRYSTMEKAHVGYSNFESTEFSHSKIPERMIQVSKKLDMDDDRIDFAVYPMTNRISCDRMFGGDRVSPEKAIKLFEGIHPDSKTERAVLEATIATLKYIQRHQKTWQKRFSEKNEQRLK